MTLQVVGAGLGRTGTNSLQLALQQLLGGPCYHMIEVVVHPEHVPEWHRAVGGDLPDWDELFAGYSAAVDWPASAFWRELSEAYPDALVLLSFRDDPKSWWRSANRTIFEATVPEPPPEMAAWHEMVMDLLATRFTADWRDEHAAMAAYERHNDEVRSSVPAGRLVEWRPGDGWEPLCAALDLPVPVDPFPHVNTTEDFRAMAGLDDEPR